MAEAKETFKDKAAALTEHFALIALALLESLLLALIVIAGIYILDFFSSKNPIVVLMVDYSGVEGVAIFILGSISLIRDIFSEEEEESEDEGKSN